MKRFLQGVGAAALLLAAKLHETLPPTLLDLTELSENAYDPDALIMCEENLVNLLEWKLNEANMDNPWKRRERDAKS